MRKTKLRGKNTYMLAAVAAGVAGVLAISTVAIVRAVTTSNAHNRGVILFVGDSNITLGSEVIDWALTWQSHNDNGYSPVMMSRAGSAIRTSDCLISTSCTTYNYWQTKLGETLTKVSPDAIVTDLGINDTATSGTAGTPGYSYYGQKIDWFMKLVPAGKPVFWTNLPCAIEPPDRLTGCLTVNAALSQAPKRWPNLHLINWALVANTHPEYMANVGQPGAVHYNGTGDGVWANTVLSALDAYFPIPNN